MARLFGLIALAGLILGTSPALAGGHQPAHQPSHHTSVPELSTTGAAAGLVVLAGTAAVILARRRKRKP
jgi:LPXTG-motif cell wall-anchored protein